MFNRLSHRAATQTAKKCFASSRHHRRPAKNYSSKAEDPEQPDLSALRSEMIARKFPLSYDYLDPRQSYLLNVTLSDYLPKFASEKPYSDCVIPFYGDDNVLPPSHHLTYFPPSMPDSILLPDGTDARQSPGPPFVRRMWAGGEMHFNNSAARRLTLDGSRMACVENIRDLVVKGHPGDEKLFVSMERRIGVCEDNEPEEAIRARLAHDEETGVIEIRNIVFMKPQGSSRSGGKKKRPHSPKPDRIPDYTHTLLPNPKLLFRYSALTFNTHAIHRDPDYCRNIEHHPNLIVHGPLSLTLLTTLLRLHLLRAHRDKHVAIKSIAYRNTHPLYNGDPLRVCGREVRGKGEWEVWAETPAGEVAVDGRVVVEVLEGWGDPKAEFQDVGELGVLG